MNQENIFNIDQAGTYLVRQQLLQQKKKNLFLASLRWLLIICLWTIACLAVTLGAFVLSFLIFPPFGKEHAARVLLIGLDQKDGGVQRSDTIMLLGAKLDGSGATLLSVPRDARVTLPGHRRYSKINAAYANGKADKLQETLRQSDVMDADLPYYIIFDSRTVAKVIDALGGIEVEVPRNMDYDDNWGNLHIHLKKGNRHLNGMQAVGFLRWRKNNNGRGASDDFSRTERQRQLTVAIKDKLRTWDGVKRIPAMYKEFQRYSKTNLTLPQIMMLGWNSRKMASDTVPGDSRTIRGVSYVICDWEAARNTWQRATK